MSTSLILPSPIQSLKCRVGSIEISPCNLLSLVYSLLFSVYGQKLCLVSWNMGCFAGYGTWTTWHPGQPRWSYQTSESTKRLAGLRHFHNITESCLWGCILFWNSVRSDVWIFMLQEVVLSSQQDAFFKANMYENFGDLGANIKKLVDEFQLKSKSNQNIQSLGEVPLSLLSRFHEFHLIFWKSYWFVWVDAEDMVKFVENYPEYRKQHGNVSKHVTMMTELSRIVDERQLMAISQIEQELACNANQAISFEVSLPFSHFHYTENHTRKKW